VVVSSSLLFGEEQISAPAKSLKVGDHIRASMHGGKIVDATIKAVLGGYTDRPRHQVEFGNNQTALIREW
jgi:hypothetical protein